MALHGINHAGDWLWRCQIAKAPSCHGIRFAEAVDRDCEVIGFWRDRGNADMLSTIVGEFFVNFVGKDEDVLFSCYFGKGLEFFAGVDRAGRVAWRVDDNHLRPWRHRVFEILGRDLPVVFLGGLHKNGFATDEANHLGIAQPVGSGNDHFIAFIHYRSDGIEARVLGSAANNHLAWLVIEAVVFEKFLGNRLAEFRNAGTGSVFGATILEGLDGGRLDMFRGVHVGLSSAEAVNFDAFGFHGLGLAVNGKSEGWCELLKSGRCFHEKELFCFLCCAVA